MSVLQAIIVSYLLFSVVYWAFALSCAVAFFRRRGSTHTSHLPPVAILKPVRGARPGSYEDFLSFCSQAYPVYQVLFGFSDPSDPAIPLIEPIRQQFPERDIAIIVAKEVWGSNPKVKVLKALSIQAKYDLFVISDDDIRVDRDYLRRVVPPLLDLKKGLVTCLYRSVEGKGLVAGLAALATSAEFIPSVLVADRLQRVAFALGATMALRRDVLEKVGGFEALADYLADDYRLGQLVHQAGFEVSVLDYIVEHRSGNRSLLEFLQRELRWARTIRSCRPFSYLGTILTNVTLPAVLVLIITGFNPLALRLAGFALSVRLLIAAILNYQFFKDRLALRFLWLLPVKELISSGIWVASFIGNGVRWAGQRYHLRRGSQIAAEG